MKERILVVDDDRQIVRLIQSYLEQAGYQVMTAYDGTTALRSIRTERPDLVVLDLMLPDQDSWAITSTVRSDSGLSGLPIIMLTARADDTDKIVGLELGADDYITKPFNPREVVARVRAVLRRGSGEVAQSRVLQAGALRLDLDRHVCTRDGQPIELTPTEFDLLKVLMEYPGHAFTRCRPTPTAYVRCSTICSPMHCAIHRSAGQSPCKRLNGDDPPAQLAPEAHSIDKMTR
jgi:DNA-binding response OmpR family regulator